MYTRERTVYLVRDGLAMCFEEDKRSLQKALQAATRTKAVVGVTGLLFSVHRLASYRVGVL